MNWLTNFIRPKIRSIIEQQKDVPENLWQKCPSCEGMLFHRDIKESLNVCYHCGHHMRISVEERLEVMFDDGKYTKVAAPKVPHDPLKFKDRKKYSDRLRDTRAKTGQEDAIRIAKGTIGGCPVVIAAFDFAFMGGSMGAAVGEGIVKAAEVAVKEKAAFITVPCSGGARMQEGAISLMQMPRTTIAVNRVQNAGLPYIVLLTDPTTGGVSASFAMLGDIHIAEPGCMIGFAGKRVIQETIREELPDGFQTAEYCLEHGMIDMVVPRDELNATLSRILNIIFNKKIKVKKGDTNGKKSGGSDKKVVSGKPSGVKAELTQKTTADKAVKNAPANTNADAGQKTATKTAARTSAKK